MKLQDRLPLLFALLEGGVIWTWVALMTGYSRGSEELAALAAFLPYMLFVRWTMQIVYEKRNVRDAAITGAVLIGAAAFALFLGLGTDAFLFWALMGGLFFVYRYAAFLREDEKLEDLFTKQFRLEIIGVPILCVIGIAGGSHSLTVGAAIVGYFLFRGLSLVLGQSYERGAWFFEGKSFIFAVGLTAVSLIVLVAPVFLLIPLAWVSAGILYVLGPLIRAAHLSLPEHKGENGAGKTADSLREQLEQSQSNGSHGLYAVPAIVWIAALFFVGVAILIIVFRREKQEEKEDKVMPIVDVRISRSRIPAKRKAIAFMGTVSPVRLLYQRMLRAMEQAGLPLRAHETAREYAYRLREETGQAGSSFHGALDDLTVIYEEARYDTSQEQAGFGRNGQEDGGNGKSTSIRREEREIQAKAALNRILGAVGDVKQHPKTEGDPHG
ncbi:DUF4129 domain-containing protein [Gorillibacterium massiliense]|uniref:DUF4129 domain-containing protein n=1 Tax=Gorillibacterium massiliense TaxID=1280390 RepID=UPI0004BAFCCF|nr:DUF4129 domain-containing protein [Gorillibacterium massiliense]